MSCTTITQMESSTSLRNRVIGCAAQEGLDDPRGFTDRNLLAMAAATDWVSAWSYAEDEYNVNQNPDTGARLDVITDAMILSAVQARSPQS